MPGSTIANMTALWAARELRGITTVVASEKSHLSMRKAADILGLKYVAVPTDDTHLITPYTGYLLRGFQTFSRGKDSVADFPAQ